MGTMLAQKKPLESIQRSQAINFVAEIFYDELQFILDRRCWTILWLIAMV